MLIPFILLLSFSGASLLLSDAQLPSLKALSSLLHTLPDKQKRRKETAREFVDRIEGRAKVGYLQRNHQEALHALEQTGHKGRYRRTLRMAYLSAAGGACIGLYMKSLLLCLVLGCGLYFIPLWTTQFVVYNHKRFINEELEVALNLITTAYIRSNDIIQSVEENLVNLNGPVREAFTSFVDEIKYINSNTVACIERLKGRLDSSLFRQWCDNLILCQSDHTLKSSLVPIVSKFSDLKTQQRENETLMMKPMQNAIIITGMAIGSIPLMYFMNADWFNFLVGSFWGQCSIAITALMSLATINKAIKLSKPIEYDV